MTSGAELLKDYPDPYNHSTSLHFDPANGNRDPLRPQHAQPSSPFSFGATNNFGEDTLFEMSKPIPPYDSFVPYNAKFSEQLGFDNLNTDWDQLDMKISRLNLTSTELSAGEEDLFLDHSTGSFDSSTRLPVQRAGRPAEEIDMRISQQDPARSYLTAYMWQNPSTDNSKHFDSFSRYPAVHGRGALGYDAHSVPNLASNESSFMPFHSGASFPAGHVQDPRRQPPMNPGVPGAGYGRNMNFPGPSVPPNVLNNGLFAKAPQGVPPLGNGFSELPRAPTRNNPPSPRKSEQELSQSPNAQTPQVTCRYFINGYCSRGDRCNYSHTTGAPEEKDKRAAPSARANPRGRLVRAPAPPVEPVKKLAIDISRVQTIEQVLGQIYRICKDQHGCRFLQTKLEEKDPRSVDLIFDEVYDHMVELMTDPFGNYLCQKLREHCNEQQQLLIVQKVAPHMVNISKNMHGTRAVQKMIECLCTASQVQLVVNALKSSVVELIQDLNGNHVIQRCLVKLSTSDKQFVYDAVAANCVAVATHRHGCCVMQRCIDHASQDQKLQLVREIVNNVLVLVKDPFGNYVVQYVLDLPFSVVKVRLMQQFLGHLAGLSTQKFSSNVIEKCLGVADEKVKTQLIDELTQSDTLQCLLQDPYGNYVIQTALSLARPQQRVKLVEEIKPLLPALRNTPYGKRIQNLIV